MSDVIDRIIRVMDTNGIDYSRGVISSEIESVQFVSALLDLENEFGVEIPEEMIRYEVFYNLDVLETKIQKLING